MWPFLEQQCFNDRRSQHISDHFQLIGRGRAARDEGVLGFERRETALHARALADATLACGADTVEIRLTDYSEGRMRRVTDHVRDEVRDDRVRVTDDPNRPSGEAYYGELCLKAFATFDGQTIEVG
jgi:hypothetical protein